MNQTSLNLKDAIDQYFLACKVNNISERTIDGYRYNLKKFFDVVRDMPVTELSANHIRTFLAHEMERTNERTGKELSSQTRYKAYSVVRSFCNWMVDDNLIQSAPTDKIKPPKVDEDLPEALTQDEISRIFNYLDRYCSFRDKVIFEFFLDTGCRVNEVANLTIDDVHIQDGWAKVFGKGRKEGIVPMGDTLCRDLHRYITIHRRAPESEKGLFVSSREPYNQLTRDGIITLIKRINKAAGVKGKYGPHKLRHTMATQYIKNGGDVAILRKILRHSNITITQRYINLVADDIQTAHRDFSPLDRLRK
jgi:integrase/recombinase XerD